MLSDTLDTYFPELVKYPELKQELVAVSTLMKFTKGSIILKQDAYIKVIPFVISGLVKVFKEEVESGNEVLLYYIKPGESCVMSITSTFRNETSKIKARIEEEAEIIVIPTERIIELAKKYPIWNSFIYNLFNIKFSELLHVIEILTFSNKDIRLLEYLKKEASIKGSPYILSTHQHIADDLGSSREVISRLLKKLEHNKLVSLSKGRIELLKT